MQMHSIIRTNSQTTTIENHERINIKFGKKNQFISVPSSNLESLEEKEQYQIRRNSDIPLYVSVSALFNSIIIETGLRTFNHTALFLNRRFFLDQLLSHAPSLTKVKKILLLLNLAKERLIHIRPIGTRLLLSGEPFELPFMLSIEQDQHEKMHNVTLIKEKTLFPKLSKMSPVIERILIKIGKQERDVTIEIDKEERSYFGPNSKDADFVRRVIVYPNNKEKKHDILIIPDITNISSNGSFKTVYKATSLFTKKEYAIFCLRQNTAPYRAYFTADIVLSMGLQKELGDDLIHPYLYAVSKQNCTFAISEWMDYDLFAAREIIFQFPPEKKIALIRSIVEKFEQITKKGIIHGDIKIDNILIKMDKTKQEIINICFCDYSFAEKEGVLSKNPGNLLFLSPERAKNNLDENYFYPASVKSDIWSLGCALFSLIHQKEYITFNEDEKPNNKMDYEKILERAKKQFPQEKNPFLSRMLEEDPEKRATVGEIMELVQKLDASFLTSTSDLQEISSSQEEKAEIFFS